MYINEIKPQMYKLIVIQYNCELIDLHQQRVKYKVFPIELIFLLYFLWIHKPSWFIK